MRSFHVGLKHWVMVAVLGLTVATVACGDADGAANQNGNGNQSAALCGNGVVEGSEACDEGAENSDTAPDRCRTDCTAPRCGDGAIDTGELCDDGPANAPDVPDACRPGCVPPTCGDGIVDRRFGERCDDANDAPGDGCHACAPEVCGNGIVDAGEACDDGGHQSGDGCNASCTSDETCGNGVVDAVVGEECDDGGTSPGDGCGPTCRIERCGNGVLDPGELCDDGNLLGADGCSGDCQSREICGDGRTNWAAGEQCDDGNLQSHDGCSSGCTVETPQWIPWQSAWLPRTEHGLVRDPAGQRLVLFGGKAGGAYRNDTWVYDGSVWAPLHPTTAPAVRGRGFGLTLDIARQRVVLVGVDEADPLRLATWELAGSTWEEKSLAVSPPGVEYPALGYDHLRNRLVLFGGRSTAPGTPLSAATWELDGASWQLISTPTAPSARERAELAYDFERQRLVLVGGNDGEDRFDTWEYDGTTWTAVATPQSPYYSGAIPTRRLVYWGSEMKLALVDFPGSLYLYSGTTWERRVLPGAIDSREGYAVAGSPDSGVILVGGALSGVSYADTWSLESAAWSEITPPLTPTPRIASALCRDPERGRTILYGGLLDSAVDSSTWELDGEVWRRRDTAHHPTSRRSHRLAHDRVHGRTVLFGGVDPVDDGPLGETWTYDGADWLRLVTTGSPPPRQDPGLAHDEHLGVTVLHGGLDGNGPLHDTWLLAGSTWSQVTTGLVPPTTRPPTLTYDPLHGVVLVADDPAQPLWAFTGTDWTPVPGTDPPPPRGQVALAYNADTRRLTLFGGSTAIDLLGDTWELDAGAWIQPSLLGLPPGPRTSLMVYDEMYRRLVLFGGQGDGYLGDTWTYQYRSTWSDEVCGNERDDDADGLIDCADPDCAAKPACHEDCSNGIDDNGDGAVDCADPACGFSPACPETRCDDGRDDDRDGRIDCLDPDCSFTPACP